jgi:hypothetical protein
MATQQEINDFLFTVYSVQVRLGNDFSKLLEIEGERDNEFSKTKIILISYYSRILTDYFNQNNYSENNFFTIDEIKEIIQNFNDICNTDYTITL